MDEQIAQQLGMGALSLVAGIAAWLLPLQWNPFRLKRLFARFISAEANLLIARIIGTILAVFGIAMFIGTAVVGKFK